jgi:hypothetical protein
MPMQSVPNTMWLGPSGMPLGQVGPRSPGPAEPLGVAQASGAPQVATGMDPVKAIAIAAVVLIALRFALEWVDAHTAVDVQRIVTPSIYNFVIVGLMVTLFIALEAVVFNKFRVPGWTEVVNTVA